MPRVTQRGPLPEVHSLEGHVRQDIRPTGGQEWERSYRAVHESSRQPSTRDSPGFSQRPSPGRGPKPGRAEESSNWQVLGYAALRHSSPLIVSKESYSSHWGSEKKGRKHSNNIAHLHHFVKASNLLDVFLSKVHRSDANGRLLQTLQLVLTHCQLDLSIRSRIGGFGCSQQVVYSHPANMPMFLDKKWNLNLEYLLHIVNFFKYHMKTETENTLYPLLCDLENLERPQAWNRPISQGCGVKPLGTNWKGSYGESMRRGLV